MTRATINQQLRANQVSMILCMRKQEGLKQLFDAAAFAGDGQEAQRVREQLMTAFEEMLDLSASAMTLTRQLMELPG